MNLVFHTLFSISTSSMCAKKAEEDNKSLQYIVIGFTGNIIGHGIMDLIPHNYPLTTITDVVISFIIFLISIAFIKKKCLSAVSLCFLGGILPDLIDKGLLSIIGANNLKVFPWHWYNVINFFYKWYFDYIEYFYAFNIIVISLSVLILIFNRKFIFNHMLRFYKRVINKMIE